MNLLNKKKYIFGFAMIAFTSVLPIAFAGNLKTADEATKKLATYTKSDILGDQKRLDAHEPLKIDEIFSDLEDVAKPANKIALNEDLVFQLERVSLLTLLHDPSGMALDIIVPLYSKNLNLFEKAALQLHPKDTLFILKVLKSRAEAAKNGNG